MRTWIFIIALLFSPVLCVRAHDDGNSKPGTGPSYPPNNKIRGKKNGAYTLVTAGDYAGTGTGSVSDSLVSIYVELQAPDGSTITLSFNNMTRVNDSFQATATYAGITFTLSGRIDLPANTDSSQTINQAMTGRVTAIIIDSAGKGTRIVAIQDAASRGTGSI